VWLEGADLIGARLEGANLAQARLEGVDLIRARLEGADLSKARLEGADLFEARLEGANLSGSRLDGADLRSADFRNSVWASASSRASPAHSADFRGAQGLTQGRLDRWIGDRDTLLPVGLSEAGEAWYVWSCWDVPPPDLDGIVATAADVIEIGPPPSELRDDFLCDREPRHKTGTPLPIDAPYPPGHPLADRR
jgi:uncharacterized protein YjbI with pentapeptide repeats